MGWKADAIAEDRWNRIAPVARALSAPLRGFPYSRGGEAAGQRS